ncbi:MAG TPA: ATP-binding protein, partial [Anaeromyxobacteraceae bacterium]|nr:ATP-binding protein [Anaeromyxobacteraceae bacterium]
HTRRPNDRREISGSVSTVAAIRSTVCELNHWPKIHTHPVWHRTPLGLTVSECQVLGASVWLTHERFAPWGWDVCYVVPLGAKQAPVRALLSRLLALAAIGLALGGAIAWAGSAQIGTIIRQVLSETGRLRSAVAAGDLSVRGDAQRIEPEFRPIVETFNATMDAFERPVRVTVECATEISQGRAPSPIAERYEGDFNVIKEALNRCIEAVTQLKDREVQLALAQQVAHTGNWVWELATDDVCWSDELYRSLGMKPGECKPSYELFVQFVHPDDRETVRDTHARALEDRGAFELEYRIVRPDGQVRFVYGRGQVLTGPDGIPFKLIGTRQDVTDLKDIQARLIVAERMASLGTLAGGIAHEINNPLAYVMSNLRFIAEQLVGLGAKVSGETAEVVSETIRGAEQIRAIVQNLNAFSRADEQRGPADAIRALELAISLGSNEIRYRARLVREYGDIPPVEANASRLGQVFLNLLVNAAHAIAEGRPKDNEIRVVTRMEGDDHVAIEIHDTGCGIPPDVQKRMFEPFFTTKPVGKGTGLGLSICHGIVKSFGGKIFVVSEIGKGTMFRVVLEVAGGYDGKRQNRPGNELPLPASRMTADA